MKKATLFVLCLTLVLTNAFAANFSPTLLKLSVPPAIQYNFDGSELQIPVQVTGTNALLWFFVFTKDQAEKIEQVQNGFMGWHYVNKIDTCIYMSSSSNFSRGSNFVRWDGKDNDGSAVPAGDYTYYMWAYDGISLKTPVCNFIRGQYHRVDFQEVDENGNPMANPILSSSIITWDSYIQKNTYVMSQRWIVGNDPQDSTLVETCHIGAPSGWNIASRNNSWMEQTDFNYIFHGIVNDESRVIGITKWKWVPNGEADIVLDFADNGYALWGFQNPKAPPVIVSDLNYIYTVDQEYVSSEGYSSFLAISFEGDVIAELEMMEWWADPDDLEAGGQMGGGPNDHNIRNGKLFLNCHCSCLNQMVDPVAWLESGDSDDFYLWSNSNGDYILDKNFLETDVRPWVCNDYNAGPYKYNITMDDNLFSMVVANGIGAVSFGLLAPDGTGVGYLSYAGDTSDSKYGNYIVDSGTPFDGIYCDNITGAATEEERLGTWFIAHDSINGVITNSPTAVDEAPAAFSVDQNSPNPFNPSTTISFSIPEAGTVSIDVFNVAGQKIDTIASEFMSVGSHSVTWDASAFSAGVYFYTVKSDDFSRTMKMTLLK